MEDFAIAILPQIDGLDLIILATKELTRIKTCKRNYMTAGWDYAFFVIYISTMNEFSNSASKIVPIFLHVSR